MSLDEPKKPTRIGVFIPPNDPFWVVVQKEVYRIVQQLGHTLVPMDLFDYFDVIHTLKPDELVEELEAQELDALITLEMPVDVFEKLLAKGLPVVCLSETKLRHPRFASISGLYEAAFIMGNHIRLEMGGRGRILILTAQFADAEERGETRIRGFLDGLGRDSQYEILYCPADWTYETAYQQTLEMLKEIDLPEIIFGVSDSLALGARDAALALGKDIRQTRILGINGDPMALAAVMEGSMYATVETSAVAFGQKASELAIQAAQGASLPEQFPHTLRLVTAENVADVSVQKLVAIADFPNQFVGINRRGEQNRIRQLETSAEINRRVGALLNRNDLLTEVADLIRSRYEFDFVDLYTWKETDQTLVLEVSNQQKNSAGFPQPLPLEPGSLLSEVIEKKEAVIITDNRFQQRYPAASKDQAIRSRAVLPLRLGDQVLGVIDLQNLNASLRLRWEGAGLQSLADQVAIALRNADLYSEAVQARQVAEQANQLKSRLLANISHELRTPLNIILGYSQAALADPNPYNAKLPDPLLQDLGYIYQSGEHLMRLINDLLDLSRAEIGALEIYPEVVDTHSVLEKVFMSMAGSKATGPEVEWKLALPARLPFLQVDPLRLDQVLLNLMSNAAKNTKKGWIELGADVEPPYLHFWVADSGEGIEVGMQERIFEPFAPGSRRGRRDGVGLGLSITRYLVALHGGTISLESQPGQGSTFHVYLPLPNLEGSWGAHPETGDRPAILVVSAQNRLAPEIEQMANGRNLIVRVISHNEDLPALMAEVQPVALAWDMQDNTPEEWATMQRLQSFVPMTRLPFIVYHRMDDPDNNEPGLTPVLLKPVGKNALGSLINALQPDPCKPVWVVDDDKESGTLFASWVEQSLPGMVVRRFENGEAALNQLEEETPALVILDLMMPKVDGFAVLEQLRKHGPTLRTPVIVMSGKMLTYEDVQRLDYARVVFQSKEIASADEVMKVMQDSLAGEIALRQPSSSLAKRVLAYLHQNFTSPISRKQVADAIGVSESYLTIIFRQEMSITPWEYVNRLRLQKAKELLTQTDEKVSAIALQVGFEDSAYFSRVFHKLTGVSPQQYRDQANG